jgi:pSer/pThr/pTyr-binding forkhead associated (FHA) protein/tetratricopeptide (TPR) repeat protein
VFKLIIEDDEGKTTVVPLIRDEITIGRKEGNTIRLTERNVSRRHAKLTRQNGSVYIEDLTSYTGTKVNGDRIAGRSPINEGDRIQIGDYHLALKTERAQGETAPETVPASEKTAPFIRDEGEPTGELDLSPTVQTPLVPVVEGPARLVVVSSNFAGQEFLVDKPSIVIGRTDENDVVVNHRSISRHHAKVVREAGKFHIVDLQSANGVRVNGEEYGKVELRKGDHIDLGHVRLRFVAPGEDFVFERDAEVVDVGGRSSRGAIMALLGVVAVAVIGGGVFLWWSKSHTPGSTPVADSKPQVAMLVLEAETSIKSEDWEKVIAKCDEALKLDPSLEVARDKRQKAMAELSYRRAFQDYNAAAEKNDLDAAVDAYRKIGDDSIYKPRLAQSWSTVRMAYLRMHLDAAKKARAANLCDEAREHVEKVMVVDEENREAKELIRNCTPKATPQHDNQPAAQKKPPREPAAPPPVKKPPHQEAPVVHEPEEPAEPATPNPAIEKILQEAQESYVHGQYAQAIEQAKKAARSQPAKAWRIIGASNCFLKDRNGAVAAWNKLDAQGRQFLKYVCSRNAVAVP